MNNTLLNLCKSFFIVGVINIVFMFLFWRFDWFFIRLIIIGTFTLFIILNIIDKEYYKEKHRELMADAFETERTAIVRGLVKDIKKSSQNVDDIIPMLEEKYLGKKKQ